MNPVKLAWEEYQAAAARYGVGASETKAAHRKYARALTAARKRRQEKS